MRSFLIVFFTALVSLSAFSQKKKIETSAAYFPDRHEWQRKAPAEVGMNAARVREVIAFARENETKGPRNMEVSQAQSFGKEPFGEGVGPFETRGEPSGVILRRGYLAVERGEPARPDMTHSVTRSFLSTVVGLGVERGLIHSVQHRPHQ